MDKDLCNVLFNRLKGVNFSVKYWDGDVVAFGDGPPAFQCAFSQKPSLSALTADPILTLGEAYMDGAVDFTGDWEAMFRLVHLHQTASAASLTGKVISAVRGLAPAISRAGQQDNIEAHYDLGNDFFSLWLDETLSYSCAYFETAEDDDLKAAQLRKIDLALKKVRLKPEQRLLDIGCGWGWLVMRAAEAYGARALGITLSQEQEVEAGRRIRAAGLADRVEIRLENYLELREPAGAFDTVVSIGMFEHVGRAYYKDFLAKAAELLRPGGLFLLHTLTNHVEVETNSWVSKHIFPGGCIPSLREIVSLLPDYNFQLLHLESLRRHYVRTLELWYRNFSSPEVTRAVLGKFGKRFIRRWTLYLLGAASALRSGYLDVHQLVMSKGPNNELPMTLRDVYC